MECLSGGLIERNGCNMESFQNFKEEFNRPKYSEKELQSILERTINSMTNINRVIQHVNGRQDVQISLQILAIHRYPDGITVIVK